MMHSCLTLYIWKSWNVSEAHFPRAQLSLRHLTVGLEHTPNMAVYETTLSTYWNPEKNNRCLGRSTNELGYLWTLQQVIPSELVMPCMSFLYYQQPVCWRIDDIYSLKRAETLLTWMGEKWWPTTAPNTLFAIIDYFDKMVPSFICQRYHKSCWCYSRQTIWING